MELVTCLLLTALIGCCVPTTAANHKRYDGDQVLLFPVESFASWHHVLTVLKEQIPVQDLDIWKFPVSNRPGYVRIPSAHLTAVEHSLKTEHIDYSIAIEDVQSLISTSQPGPSRHGARHPIVGTFPMYAEIIAWMEDLATEFPELASTFSIGNTYEGRPMQVLKLGLGTQQKWKVWLDSGMHAREWIGPTTAIYVVDQLIYGYENIDPETVSFLETLEFHFLVSANPDGYDYTFTTDRAWRKNRRPDLTSGCVGVDLNRNFGFEWGGANADPDPCSTMFMGPTPESEVEVQNIVNYILAQAASFIWYHSYHSWGELFFTRWDYTAEQVPPDHDELLALAERSVDAINAVNNEYYMAGTAPTLMYPFSGSSADWSRGVAQIKYPFLQELRDYNGTYAFYPPPSEIIPCGEENWAGFLVVLREIMTNYGGITPP